MGESTDAGADATVRRANPELALRRNRARDRRSRKTGLADQLLYFLKFSPYGIAAAFVWGIAFEAGYLYGLGFRDNYGLDGMLLVPLALQDYLKATIVSAGAVLILLLLPAASAAIWYLLVQATWKFLIPAARATYGRRPAPNPRRLAKWNVAVTRARPWLIAVLGAVVAVLLVRRGHHDLDLLGALSTLLLAFGCAVGPIYFEAAKQAPSLLDRRAAIAVCVAAMAWTVFSAHDVGYLTASDALNSEREYDIELNQDGGRPVLHIKAKWLRSYDRAVVLLVSEPRFPPDRMLIVRPDDIMSVSAYTSDVLHRH